MLNGGLIVDSFAGGGGASQGIEEATGRDVDIAINHDEVALAVHAANHPRTQHLVEDVWHADPRQVTAGRPVAVAWFSPDCKHFSKAKGGKPVERGIRGLAWVVIRWAALPRPQKPAVIVVENVEEFQDWGPLGPDGRPCPDTKGRTFKLWVRRLRQCGYQVEWHELRACDYGAPTTRRRLFLIARSDGERIRWPKPTHGEPGTIEVVAGMLKPWRTAAECIDWSIPCPSIFGRDKPLAEATLKRIAHGIKRFIVNSPNPFIVNLTHHGSHRCEPLDEPLRTITGTNRGEKALVAPFFVPRHGERDGQDPRCISIERPMPVVTATANGASLVAAYMSAFLTKFYGTCKDGIDMRQPFSTVTAEGWKFAEVRAFLMKYYGTGGQHAACTDPMHTLPTKARMGLVTVSGIAYQIVDIGMRMLTPRELFRAQGFPESYIIDRTADGAPVTKTAQIRLCGNSVSPPVARAILAANVGPGVRGEVVAMQQERRAS